MSLKKVYNAKIKIFKIKYLLLLTQLLYEVSYYIATINEVKGEIATIANLATTTTALDAEKNKIKNKIPNITNLATTTTTTTTTTTAAAAAGFTAVETKKPNVSNLVKKRLTIAQKMLKLKMKLLLIIINILRLKNLVS